MMPLPATPRASRRSLTFAPVLARSGLVGWGCLACLLIGCGNGNRSDAAITTEAPAAPATQPVALNNETGSAPGAGQSPTVNRVAAVDANREIANGRLGRVRLGMTLAEAKRLMGPNVRWENVPNLLVDFGGIAAKSGSQTLFYVIYEAAGGAPRDRDPISMLMTENAAYKTAEGIGPGSSIAQAEAVYGKATLSFNWDDEAREYVKFASQPVGLIFRTQGQPNDFDGNYPTTQGQSDSFYSTQRYHPTAAIKAVWVASP